MSGKTESVWWIRRGYTERELMLVQGVNGSSCKFHVACVHKMADTSKTSESSADGREAITGYEGNIDTIRRSEVN